MRLGLFDRVATSLFARVGPPMTGLSAPGLPPRVPISGPFGLSVRDILGTLLRPFTLRVVCAAALACIFFAFDFFTPAPIRHLRQPRMRTPRPIRRRPAPAALRALTDAAYSAASQQRAKGASVSITALQDGSAIRPRGVVHPCSRSRCHSGLMAAKDVFAAAHASPRRSSRGAPGSLDRRELVV